MNRAFALATLAIFSTLITPAQASGYFSPNLHLASAASSQIFLIKDVEPSIRVDSTGRIFVSAIHGVPGGTDLFQVAPSGLTYTYRGEPDGLPVFTPSTGLAPGGGDTDLAIGSFNPRTPGVPGPLLITSLNLGTIYSSMTANAGATYTPGGNAAGAFFGVDRQWNNAFGGLERYDVVHDLATSNIQFSRSLDGGLTWVNGTPTDSQILATATQNNEIGPIVVDQNHLPGQILYEVFVSGATPQDNINAAPLHTIWVARSTDDGVTWTDHQVFSGPTTASLAHLFPSMAVDALGNLYAVWSDDHDVFYAYSTNHGDTWSPAYKATNSLADGGYKTHIFPWIAAGFNGGIDIVYYETKGINPSLATDQWQVGMAQNYQVLAHPTSIQYFTASDHVIHTGQICENGIGCDSTQKGNRNLADDFQIALDPRGCANIAFTDDHAPGQPQTYFTKQLYGVCLGTPNGGGPNKGCAQFGHALPGSTAPTSANIAVTVKAPQYASRGWVTVLVNRAVAIAGYINTYNSVSTTQATFSGVSRSNVPISGSIQGGVLTIQQGTQHINAQLTSGTSYL